MSDAIEWLSDGPVLHLADGRTVRPVVKDPDTEAPERYIALSVAPVDEYATYGPEVDDDRVAVWFEEFDPDDAG